MSEMVERVAKAIEDAPRIWFRDNPATNCWEVCRYGADDEPEIVVLECWGNESAAWAAQGRIVSEMRARAAIEAMQQPTAVMVDRAWELIWSNLRYEEAYRHLIAAALLPGKRKFVVDRQGGASVIVEATTEDAAFDFALRFGGPGAAPIVSVKPLDEQSPEGQS